MNSRAFKADIYVKASGCAEPRAVNAWRVGRFFVITVGNHSMWSHPGPHLGTNYREAHPGSQTALKSLRATSGDATAPACPGNGSAETLRCSSTQTIKNTVWASKRKSEDWEQGREAPGHESRSAAEGWAPRA